MNKVIILRYSEVHLKGGNRGFFEKQLLDNTKRALAEFSCKVEKSTSRYIVRNFASDDEKLIINQLRKVFGFNSLSIAIEVDSTKAEILKAVRTFDLNNCTFRVSTKRADKMFETNSKDFSALVGAFVLDNFEGAKVSLESFQKELSIDIRENKKTFLYLDSIQCAGGMPSGCAGRAMCLLSGGIDSPVATYKIARRGANIYALHFHSYPYTSDKAKQKVIDLAKIVASYCGTIKMYVVSITDLQQEIIKKCNKNYMIALMRRVMMRIAERLCHKTGCGAIVTGESLGQVASQTMESIVSSNSVVDLPVYRPLIGDDKDDIIRVAKAIGTFETSILPYEDCCTVFLPDSPVVRPKLEDVEREEKRLDVESIVEECLKNVEYIEIK